jgi:hypothetical protein
VRANLGGIIYTVVARFGRHIDWKGVSSLFPVASVVFVYPTSNPVAEFWNCANSC